MARFNKLDKTLNVLHETGYTLHTLRLLSFVRTPRTYSQIEHHLDIHYQALIKMISRNGELFIKYRNEGAARVNGDSMFFIGQSVLGSEIIKEMKF